MYYLFFPLFSLRLNFILFFGLCFGDLGPFFVRVWVVNW